MRYYRIVITNPQTGAVVMPMAADPTCSFTSFINGQSLPGALNVELDLPLGPFSVPDAQSGAVVRIWGIPLEAIAQANNLNKMNIQVFGGMQKGLPLANPAQAGLLVQGQIFQAFGNWIGTDMTLDLVIYAGYVTPNPAQSPYGDVNLTVNWPAGTSLATVIQNTLQAAFPTYKIQGLSGINQNIVLQHDEVGFYGNLKQFGQWVKEISRDTIGGENYPGVDFTLVGNTFKFFDGTTAAKPIAIAFTDLVGQPTWTGTTQIQVTVVLRGQINVGDYVTLPPTQVSTNASSLSPYRNNSIFQGTFQVQAVRHVGNFRDPNGQSWVTVIDLFSAASPTSVQSGLTPAQIQLQSKTTLFSAPVTPVTSTPLPPVQSQIQTIFSPSS